MVVCDAVIGEDVRNDLIKILFEGILLSGPLRGVTRGDVSG